MANNIRPRFQIEKIKGKLKRRVAKPNADEDGKLLGGFTFEDIEQDAGWMVYLPSGSSLHIWTQDEMERQGFLRPPGHVDMETGEEVDVPVHDLKAKSEQVANRSRGNSRAAQSGA